MAALVMQTLGCDVAALNTVQFSTLLSMPPNLNLGKLIPADAGAGNHTGYKQFTGTKASAQEIGDLYDGLKQSYLTDFNVLLTGYAPGAQAVDAIGSIARDLKLKGSMKAGSFFWSEMLFPWPYKGVHWLK